MRDYRNRQTIFLSIFACFLGLAQGCGPQADSSAKLSSFQRSQSRQGICRLSQEGPEYLKGLLPPSESALKPEDFAALSQGLTQFEAIGERVLDSPDSRREFKEAMKDLFSMPENANFTKVESQFQSVIGDLLGFSDGPRKGGIAKILALFKFLPHVSVLKDFIDVFRNNCSDGEAREAIANFVNDSIITATNRNLNEIWRNSNMDARDELKNIQKRIESIQHFNQHYLSKTLKFAQNQEEVTRLISRHMVNKFSVSREYSNLSHDVQHYFDRYRYEPRSLWGLKFAVPFKNLMELSLQLYRKELIAARNIDLATFKGQAWEDSSVDFAELAGSVELATEDFGRFVDTIQPWVREAAEMNRKHGITVEFQPASEVYWQEFNGFDYTIKLRGSVVVKLFGEVKKVFPKQGGVVVNLLDLMAELPQEEQQYVPQKKHSYRCGLLGKRKCGYNFDNDRAWPGRLVEKSWGYPDEWHPHNKWFEMTRGQFWTHIFNRRRVHELYFAKHDEEVVSFYTDLKAIAEETAAAYEDFDETLVAIQEALGSCQLGEIWSLSSCDYFADPLSDSISRAVMSSPFGGQAASLPGRIEAEDFDFGGPGISYQDSSAENIATDELLFSYRDEAVDVAPGDAGSSPVIDWFDKDEWLQYTVVLDAGGSQDLKIHVRGAGEPGLAIRLDVLDRLRQVQVSQVIPVPEGEGWQTIHQQVELPAAGGTHIVRLVAETGGVAVDWFSLETPAQQPVPAPEMSDIAIANHADEDSEQGL